MRSAAVIRLRPTPSRAPRKRKTQAQAQVVQFPASPGVTQEQIIHCRMLRAEAHRAQAEYFEVKKAIREALKAGARVEVGLENVWLNARGRLVFY